MTLDRTDESVEPHHCYRGWATPPDSDAPRRCPICRPQPPPAEVYDYDPSNLSERARAAIEKAERDE
ncbi:hypothetical protein ACW9HF_15035 [Nocardia gipuzkoensis]